MLTAEDLTVLRRPFAKEDHEFIKGFVYITEKAICERIEEVDPAWQFEIYEIKRSEVGEAVVSSALTIKGSTRYGVGMQKHNDKAGEAEKGAATDALKRAARLFGVGRYLLEAPNEQAFDRWLKSLSVQPQLKIVSSGTGHWADNENHKRLVLNALKEMNFSTKEEMAKALNRVDRRISDVPVEMRLSQSTFGSPEELIAALKRNFPKGNHADAFVGMVVPLEEE
jgi:hypothetical protein